ncbi:MAG: glycerol kinase GlpK [Acidobacteriota bacterium]|jgi:glycerol kinase|nr:glycerol kinase GlpK [Acidobacteriota bacterium]
MPDAVLAIDQGTTGSTALVLDRDGRVLGRSTEEFTQFYPQPGWVEHDPEEIWRVSLEVIGMALADAALSEGDLQAIGITNQRETTVVWDRKTGTPLHRAIVWQSRQSADICQQIRDDGLEPMITERTGLVVDPYFSGSKVKWILDHYPEARPRAEAGELVFGTIDTWMLYKLTGGKVLATEPTNACRTLLYDIRTLTWDSELLEIFGVPEAMLPEVRPSSGIFGTTVPAGDLPGGVPVAGIAGDQQAALYGQGCWQPGMVKNTYGTGCFVMLNTGSELQRSNCGLLTTVCCDATGGAAYALEGSIFTTGAAVQWLRDEMGLIGSAVETEEVAARIQDTQGVYVVPAFTGLGAPYWDMDARGAIVGLTRGSGREQIIRATLDSIAYQTRDVVDAMNCDGSTNVRELHADGGAAANNHLMQFQADILGVPVVRPRLLETTAAGSAFLAGFGVGMWRDTNELEGAWREDRRFEPVMAESERERLYLGWCNAVERVRADRREAMR